MRMMGRVQGGGSRRAARRMVGFATLSMLACTAVVLGLMGKSVAAERKSRALFNGKNLDGWAHVGAGRFVVRNGLLQTEGGMGLLWYTREKIGHARLRVVFKMEGREPDSGVFIRVPEKPTEPWMPVNRGYEVEIGDWPSDYSCTGVLYTFTKALARPLKPLGEWNTMDITIDGPSTVVFLNDVKVTDFTEGQQVPPKPEGSGDPERGRRPETGYVGLQNHPGGKVYFKEVSLAPLE